MPIITAVHTGQGQSEQLFLHLSRLSEQNKELQQRKERDKRKSRQGRSMENRNL